jgi:probable HAF family extracellular repeat protein
MMDLGTLGGNTSNAYDINNHGQIVGSSKNVAGQVHAFLYTDGAWQDLGTLAGTTSAAYGINDLGQVVGSSSISTTYTSRRGAFLWSGGVMTQLSLPGIYSSAWDINNSGQIVGQYRDPNDLNDKAFLLSGGEMTTLTLGGSYSYAFAINDNGQVTGYAQSSDGWDHAFLYDINSKVMTDLGTMGWLYSLGNGLNDLAQVVGRSTYTTSENQHAFRNTAGVWTDLGVLGGSNSEAFDINNRGQIVGESHAVSGTQIHAFVYANGVMTDLGTLGGIGSSARGINARGQIVGYYTDASMISRAFLYNPGGSSPGLFLLLE